MPIVTSVLWWLFASAQLCGPFFVQQSSLTNVSLGTSRASKYNAPDPNAPDDVQSTATLNMKIVVDWDARCPGEIARIVSGLENSLDSMTSTQYGASYQQVQQYEVQKI